MLFGENNSIEIFSWFKILFIENPGMAFGIDIIDTYILTILRIIFVFLLGGFIFSLVKRNFQFGYILCLSCIFAGALGNIIDGMFYGMLFSESNYHQVAAFMPEGGGYSTFLHGKVVDMLYFPLIRSTWPEWMPFWGGEDLVFFRPIFNIADSAICVGAFLLFIFYKDSLSTSLVKEESAHDE